MMPLKYRLRQRVAVGFAILGSTLAVGFGALVYFTSQGLDARLIDDALSAEVEDYRARLGRNPRSLPPTTATVRGYLVHQGGAGSELPEPLRNLPQGRHQVWVDGTSFRVAVVSGPDWTLYMLHDRSQLAKRDQRLIVLLLSGIAITGLLAAAWGWSLAGRVIAPVRELAERVRGQEPDQPPAPFAEQFAQDEVGELAHAFERYLTRMRAFIERERAFSADASHELRTPLAVIQGAVEVLLADRQLDERNRVRIERIGRAAHGMADLTATLLTLARERPGEGAVAGPCPVAEVVQEVVEQHQRLLRHKPVDYQLVLQGRPELAVARPLLAIAIGNLVRNAFTYTERGQVTITLTATDFSVADTGPGIPAEELCCLFEHSARARRASRGAGIGLPLVKRIADRQGWSIAVTSRTGEGAEFRLGFT